ncbi:MULTISPECIES: Na+/H+ antiporter subunit E [unclassified Microbacterium]|uniref:Na+/H+ antiporter subunit E n=1 Tax=unclassified Microbacterium TaxID=2609290 RepID=UPI0038674030
MGSDAHRSALTGIWRQLPFFVWLVAVWMLLWGQFTLLALITGIVVAVFVTAVYRLPPVELSGRLNPWWLFVFLLQFAFSLVQGSLTVAWQVLDVRRQPGVAVIAVPLVTDDDLIMAHVAVTASLIPGSLVLETDRDRRIIYLHIIGVRTAEDLERQRRSVQRWEERLVRAVGSTAQLAAVRQARGARVQGADAKDAAKESNR